MVKLIELLKGIIHDPFTGEIYEGLIKTVDIPTAVDIITKQFENLPEFNIEYDSNKKITVEFKPTYLDNTTSKYLNHSTYDPNISKLLQLINNLGYFPSSIGYEKANVFPSLELDIRYSNYELKRIMTEIKPDILILDFEKKYDDVVKVPEFVYHITDEKYLDKIKSIGLTPKTKSKLSSHPERIYVALSKENVLNLWKRMKFFISKEQGILLKINTKGLDNTFYNDPNFGNKGAYTYNNIPASNIINIEPIK